MRTRCFIDCDGTLMNSLKYYNDALDGIFMGNITNKHYIDYYKDFGDTYNIIPGSPWRTILFYLIDYLKPSRRIDIYDSNHKKEKVEIGFFDALLKVSMNAVPFGDDGIELYWKVPDNETSTAYSMSIKDIQQSLVSSRPGAAAYLSEEMPKLPIYETNINDRASSCYPSSSLVDSIEKRFNAFSARKFEELSYDELIIDPIIRFCKEYKKRGGSLVIHSGSNESIVRTMLQVCGIEWLFDDILCTDMIKDAKVSNLGDWGYKTCLLQKLQERHDDERKGFVIGDTKGDAYGARALSMPFGLAWRGYPEDPRFLSNGDGHISPDAWFDVREGVISDEQSKNVSRQILSFARTCS